MEERFTAAEPEQAASEPASDAPRQPAASEAHVAAEPVAPPVSDLSGVQIEQPQPADQPAEPPQAAESHAAQEQHAQPQQERSEGAVSRFFKALLGRKS